MTYPAGVQLSTLTFSNPTTFLGNQATRTEVTVQSSAGVVWSATGEPIDDFAEVVAPNAGLPGFLTVPFVDQPGFTDQSGNAFTMWAYTITRRTFFGSSMKVVQKNWQPLVGQSNVDFDNLPGGNIGLPVSAPIVPVTSVAGETGVVQAEALAGALTEFLPYADKSVETEVNGKVAKGSFVVSVKDCGAVGNGVADDSAAVQTAINVAAGRPVFFPAGTYNLASTVTPVGNTVLQGVGQASVIRVPPGNTTNNALIYRTTGAWIDNVTIMDLQFEGRWDEFKSEVSGNGFITLKFIRNLRILRCHFKNSRSFTLNINDCDDVTVSDCRFENGVRDFCAVWATPHVSVINNKFQHNDDDCISISKESTTSNDPIHSGVVVTGNHLVDTGGIRTQMPKGVIIAHNTLERTMGLGIYLSVLNAGLANVGTGHSNIIQGNVIRDVIDRQWSIDGNAGTVNLRTYILVESVTPQTGGLAAVPGQINPATGTAVAPYSYNYSQATVAGNVGPLRMPHGVLVTGNICKRTLPVVAKYSDWGYGAGFSKNGWKDYAVADDHLRGCGVRLSLPLQSVVVEGNILEAGRWGVYLSKNTGVSNADRIAQGIRIRNNEIRDFDSVGIGWGETALTHQNVTIEGNHLNGDPYFLSAGRTAGGAWSASGVSPVAINVPYMGGVVIARNSVHNAGTAANQTGASTVQDVIGNLVFADPAGATYNAANKGVGTLPVIGNGAQWWILARDCDPTSATYGQSLGSTSQSASVQPTAGKWLAGMVVYSRTSAVVSGKILIGWLRLTTGSAHVAGTDWSPMYVTIT